MTWAEEVATRVIIVEYEHIKDEQKTRIGFRDNLLYATFASLAGIIAVTVSSGSRVFLLLVPPVCLVLGWTYLVNDEKISAIGRYVRGELAPRLASLTDDRTTVFSWEVAHRADRHRISRKYFQLAIDMLTFCGAPLVAVVVYWSGMWSGLPGSRTLLVVSFVELAAIAVLAAQIVMYADVKRESRLERTGRDSNRSRSWTSPWHILRTRSKARFANGAPKIRQ
ncbi:hypothetical protein [Allonocardiopsis opalescens]|uniref:Integral membrane protein n=1 Tax=Allonocardiopsis opalescens TaxID=1144618 RepID=A0A2T0PYJ1_9ACTN|nr:hypothetical protein [Allonocardiopsis opalescens]PRX96600.1 hypothetical protein CLV72_107123 [Allonocardiopsis opalescens]